MKKGSFAVRMLVLLALLALAAACGGGGGGGGGSTPLATGLFTKATATVATATGGLMDSDPYVHYQNLYLASTIKGAGKITGIAYKYPSTLVTARTCTSTTIKLGHSSLAANTTTFTSNVSNGKGGQTTVLENGTITFPADSADTWHTITFTTPFEYNGVDNLVVDVERSAACVGGDNIDAVAYGAYNATTWSFTPAAATGSVGTWIANTKFTFAGGDNTVEFGGAVSNSWPLSSDAPRVQMLYLASDITGTGPITGIGFQINALSTQQSYTYTVKLAHAMRSALTYTFADNYDAGTPVAVADGVFTVPADVPAGEYIWIPLTGNFTYDGTHNLIVDIDVSAGSGLTYLRRASTTAGRRAPGYHGSATVNGSVDDFAYHTKFRFNGGTMDTVTAGNTYDTHPFTSGSGVKRQYLYTATMLGTKGSINKLAFRLMNDSVAGTYGNFNVVLGHTVSNSLTTTYADNMTGPCTVYNGTVTIPAGKKAGDWIEIPLSSAFAYDGTSNLVVQVATDAGTADNDTFCEGASARYTGYHLYGFDPASATGGGVNNYLTDQRLWYSK